MGRGAVFVGLALVVSGMHARQTQLRFELAESERELTELESLRSALTAPELPRLEGLEVATSYTPADVTALCASFAPDLGTVTWASAGHPPPWDLVCGVALASVRHCPPLGIEPTLRDRPRRR